MFDQGGAQDGPKMRETDADRDVRDGVLRVAASELRVFVERFERLEAEKKGIADHQKEVMAEAKGRGYDTKVMRKLIALRKRSEDDIAEEEVSLKCISKRWVCDMPGIPFIPRRKDIEILELLDAHERLGLSGGALRAHMRAATGEPWSKGRVVGALNRVYNSELTCACVKPDNRNGGMPERWWA